MKRDDQTAKRISRRSALKVGLSSLAYYSTQATTPNWIIRSARALENDCISDDRILVILQQAGGNDGLNTVIPRTDAVYYDDEIRPTIRVPAGAEINLDGLNGLHPRLELLANWYQNGNVGIIQNVGYQNPSLSHFRSTDIYEFGIGAGDPTGVQGWVARFHDNACPDTENIDALRMAVAGIPHVPDAMQGMLAYLPPAIRDPSGYVLNAQRDGVARLEAIQALHMLPAPCVDCELDFLQRSGNAVEAGVDDITTAAATPLLVPAGSYPEGKLGEGLELVSQIIRAGFKTRIFYVSQGGYDTHAKQIDPNDPLNEGDHPKLLVEFDRALDAFLTEMDLSGNLHRVLVMSFSEFGRRVRENGSFGTDHGAANCSFVLGGGVAGGVYGGQPDLEDLIKGNLKHLIDFRSVYAKVLLDWFGHSAQTIQDVFGPTVYQTEILPDQRRIPFLSEPANAIPSSGWKNYD